MEIFGNPYPQPQPNYTPIISHYDRLELDSPIARDFSSQNVLVRAAILV